ncbi:hypothetical protein LEMLEM_LOCUS2224 [Lemmus lemmus]
MMLWKGGSSFVFTEDDTLWISSIPIWYDRPHPPERLQYTPSENYFTQLLTERNLAHRAFHDNETHLLLAAPISFKRKMGIEEDPYGVCQPFGQETALAWTA